MINDELRHALTREPEHNELCGSAFTGHPYCVPCHTRQARLLAEFWATMEGSSRC